MSHKVVLIASQQFTALIDYENKRVLLNILNKYLSN